MCVNNLIEYCHPRRPGESFLISIASLFLIELMGARFQFLETLSEESVRS